MRTPTPLQIRPERLLSAGLAVELLGRILADRGMPTEPATVRREDVEAFIADQVAGWRSGGLIAALLPRADGARR